MAKDMKKPGKNRQKEFVCTMRPKARDVYLVGKFTSWKPGTLRMSRAKDGTFRASVELQPGEHQYRFFIDGQWVSDDQAPTQVANPYGTMNGVVCV